jgi:group I intron endonuclease
MPKKGYIYLIRNLVNGKGYVGKTEKTVSLRFSQHKTQSKIGSTYALHAAMRKYGISNFSVIEIASSEPYQLNDLEKHFIAKYGTFAPLGNGYNLTLGGEGQTGLVHSKETRLKLSAITKAQLAKNGHPMKGKKHSAESVAKMSESRRGQPSAKKGKKCGPQSKETIAKRSESLKGHIVSAKTRAQLSASNRGQKRSIETRKNLSLSHLGKTQSVETREKRAASLKGRKRPAFSDEWKARISAGKNRQYAQMRKEAQFAHIN